MFNTGPQVNVEETYGVFLQSAPIRVTWAGWESTTYDLAQAGWEIAVSQGYHVDNMLRNNLRIAMRNKTFQLYGISHGMSIDMYRYMQEANYWKSIVIEMNGIAHDIPITYQGLVPVMFESMRPLDPVPRFEHATNTMLSQCKIFNTFDVGTEEILLEKPTLEQVLDYAIGLQEPRQKEIRQKILKRQELAAYQEPDEPDEQRTDLKAKLMLVA